MLSQEDWGNFEMINPLRASIKWCLSCSRISKVPAVVVAATLLQGAASATDPGNVVHDGQFILAQPAVPFTTYQSGEQAGAWTVKPGNVDIYPGYFVTPDEQSYVVDLNGTKPGGIVQELETVPKKVYTVTFLLSGNWEAGKGDRTLKLKAEKLDEKISLVMPAGWSPAIYEVEDGDL